MQSYGQWCPIAKASQQLCERWTILIIRELLMGSTRYSELERGLGSISPTLLSRRLKTLEDADLIYKRRLTGGRGSEYLPTVQCRQLQPILLALGSWGMDWAKSRMEDTDYDVPLLMLYLQRSIVVDKLPSMKSVIHFRFTDFAQQPKWWITASQEDVDVCTVDPGLDVDVYITTTVRAMTDAWMGRMTYKQATNQGDFEIVGPTQLTRNINAWLAACVFADLPDPDTILQMSSHLLTPR
jgi:DNA-binding HxlR family transcriptional regulator